MFPGSLTNFVRTATGSNFTYKKTPIWKFFWESPTFFRIATIKNAPGPCDTYCPQNGQTHVKTLAIFAARF